MNQYLLKLKIIKSIAYLDKSIYFTLQLEHVRLGIDDFSCLGVHPILCKVYRAFELLIPKKSKDQVLLTIVLWANLWWSGLNVRN